MVLKALKLAGEKTFREKKIIIFVWLIEAFLALVFILPYFFLLKNLFAHSLLAKNLTQGIDLIWLSDLIYQNQNLIPWLIGFGLALILIAFPLLLAIKGGFLGSLKSNLPLNLSDFLKASAYYFWPLFKLFLLFLLAMIILLLSFNSLLNFFFHFWATKATNPWPAFISGLIKFCLLFILFLLIRMVFNYTQSLLAIEDKRQVIKVLAQAVLFLARRFFSASSVFLLAVLIPLILTIFFFGLIRLWPTENLMNFWLTFLFGQIYVFSRIASQFFVLSSCYYLARQTK